MAKREVIEITCDRCTKIETQSVAEAHKAEVEGAPEFELKFAGETVAYQDLCKRCRETLSHSVKEVRKCGKPGRLPNSRDDHVKNIPAAPPEVKKTFLGRLGA